MLPGATSHSVKRTGVTLVELMIVVACLGVLMGLTLPAVLMVRESARRTQCSTNLHQIGVAVSNFHSRMGRLPTGRFGAFVEMAGELELPTLVDDDPRSPDYGFLVVRSTTPTLKCPSDFGELAIGLLGNDESANYFINNGSSIHPPNGALSVAEKGVSFNEFTDGLSMTAIFGEHPRMQALCQSCPTITRWWATDRSFRPDEEKQMREHLSMQWREKKLDSLPFFSFLGTGVGSKFPLDHRWLPNMPPVYWDVPGPFASISPASFHSGGVFILIADGSVHFISNAVDESLWTAIGSRNGHEAVSNIFE